MFHTEQYDHDMSSLLARVEVCNSESAHKEWTWYQ